MVTEFNKDIFDFDEALDNVGGSVDFLRELAMVLIEDIPNTLNNLDIAIKEKDPLAIKISAHTLKGSVSNLSAKKAAGIAMNIEQRAMQNQLADMEDLFEELKLEVSRLVDCLENI